MYSDGTRNASLPRECARESRPAESDETRDARLRRRRERSRERRATESPEHREARLGKRRRRDRARGASESHKARETRLHQARVSQQRSLATETPEETEARLHQVRVSQQRSLATETPEETEVRLHQARVSQQRSLATETPEETEARLLQLRVNQQRRLATETPEETEFPHCICIIHVSDGLLINGLWQATIIPRKRVRFRSPTMLSISLVIFKGDTTRPTHAEVIMSKRAAFLIIKSHWFKFSFNPPLERHYLSACAARDGYAHRSGKSTADSQQACREAVLVLGHRSGRARRTEATLRIRQEKLRLERCTELNLQTTMM